MKRKSLIYPTRRTSPDPSVDVVLAYAPEPAPSECAGHPGIATVYEQNLYAPGWHCAICNPLPKTKGENECTTL